MNYKVYNDFCLLNESITLLLRPHNTTFTTHDITLNYPFYTGNHIGLYNTALRSGSCCASWCQKKSKNPADIKDYDPEDWHIFHWVNTACNLMFSPTHLHKIQLLLLNFILFLKDFPPGGPSQIYFAMKFLLWYWHQNFVTVKMKSLTFLSYFFFSCCRFCRQLTRIWDCVNS